MEMMWDNVLSGIMVLLVSIAIDYFRRSFKKMKDEMQANFDELKRDSMRNRILTLLYDDPHSHLEILDLFDEYEKLGGNGSTKERILEWKKREGLD